VALSALAVLGLVGVVAVAATGSVPKGSSSSRPPSDTFLDTIFTLWIVAVVAGGVLLVYGLVQRQAIAEQMASGRYTRLSLLAFVAFVGLATVGYKALNRWTPHGREPPENVFGGARPVSPTTPGDETVTQYEPSVSWIPIAAAIALVGVAVIVYVASGRRTRHARDPHAELARDLADALDDALDDLRAEADPRRAVIAAYARLERILASAGVARIPSETPDEYLGRVLGDLELTPGAIGRLTGLFTQAKFSHHDVDSTMKEAAIGALEQVRDELRTLREQPGAPELRQQAVTS
jgi:uncharacterized membrane protein YidH (DUF202 family)